ncbi:PIR protein CIR protein [Plasmodium vinckei vinckei]|uniref:PIR protein CIR protein n=1 Tax=Plasmodium vinckei vinckei TaxID=54757 RepID=A0A449BPR8_PLAVN|nr:PIR protein CIR protein [Plasmodium vinckei vinckei]VEV55369.1 PIR protein CIR protein [Plasmodium vinckei vinckei]
MDDQVCDLLSKVDENFNNRGVSVGKFNKFKECHSYCPYQDNLKENKCTTNNDRMSALSAYLHEKISEIDKSFKNGGNNGKWHIEIFIIWLGDKLFKIDNDYKATLEESYKKNLENSMGSVNYWKVVDSRQFYKKATIKKMSEYYNLLNYICKLITEYNKNPDNSRLRNYSSQCSNYYKTIYNSIKECKPYLQLLDNLKMIYEIFRMQKIANNSNIKEPKRTRLLNRIQHLTTFENRNQLFVTVNAVLSFDDKGCTDVKSKDEEIGKSIESKNLQDKLKGTGPTKKPDIGPQKKFSPIAPQGKQRIPTPENPPTARQPQPKPKPEPKHQGPQKKESQSQQQSLHTPTSPITENKIQQPPATPTETNPQEKKTQESKPPSEPQPVHQPPVPLPEVPPAPPSQDGSSLQTAKTGEIHQNGQGGTVDRKGETSSGLGVTQDNQGGSSGGSGDRQGNGVHGSGGAGVRSGDQPVKDSQEDIGSGQGSQGITSSESGGGDDGPGPSKSGQKALDSSKGNKDGGGNGGAGTPDSGDNGGSNTKGDQGNPNVGSNDQGDKNDGSSDPASSISGGSFDLWSAFREFLLKGKEYYNNASEFIKENQQRLNDARDQISGAYSNAVNNLKNAYNASSSYFSDIISNISSQFNQVDHLPKPGGSHPGSGNPSTGGDSSNQLPPSQPQNTTDPPTPPPNSQQNLPSTPTLNPPSPTSALNHSPPSNPIQQTQPSPPTQSITLQNPQTDTSIQKTTTQINAQLLKLPISDPISRTPWNIIPTTWNGSVECKPKINFINTTLMCCTSEQCSLTGISVTLVLIPIILLIGYKYLSFGSSKKSEKKNMKRVINFHDGNRKTKIIISSNDKKKKLKPIINSIGGKKGPLLNIYKLIQADPMPFINLFFLLIFFVYKRKRDTIE